VTSPPATGSGHFAIALRLTVAAWIGCALLQLALYLRPAPYGGPFLLEWTRYFWLALYYELLGVWLLALPFLLLWLILYTRPLAGRRWRAILIAQLALLTADLALSQIDHEVLRFLGVRLNFSFLYAYAQPQMLTDALFRDVLATDRGGPFISLLLLLAIPGAYLWWGLRQLGRPGRFTIPLWLAAALTLLPPMAPANGWLQANGLFRLRKIEPLPLALGVDLGQGFADLRAPVDLDAMASAYQRDWIARSSDPNWRFPDPAHPYVRVPTDPAEPSGAEWNVIYLQLETFRGLDMGFLNPGLKPSPTPYLDTLVQRPDTALWTRAASFGMPSINGLFATHCSAAPPSQRYITAYIQTRFLCLPDLLRARGYRTEMFNGGDTDWDNSTPWLRQWYERLWRFPEARGEDRVIFRRAAQEIRRLGRSSQPFFASVVSVSNHWPFRTREPALDIAGQETPAERIRNTTHYTDAVVGEFLETLRREPWFARTLVVIAGDHGFNVGAKGRRPGRQDLYRGSVWVPLIVAGSHPRLAHGRHDTPATLLDVAPTLADLIGVRQANPWQGHSLLAVNDDVRIAFAFRRAMLSEAGGWSIVRDPEEGELRLFRTREDWLQQHDLAERFPALIPPLLERVERTRRLNDYLLRQGLIWDDRARAPTRPS
jgi:hypothetical protein